MFFAKIMLFLEGQGINGEIFMPNASAFDVKRPFVSSWTPKCYKIYRIRWETNLFVIFAP
jgi:hypothetical protein